VPKSKVKVTLCQRAPRHSL